MPHIRVRAMTDSDVKNLSQVLPKELSLLMNTPEDNFTVEKSRQFFIVRVPLLLTEKVIR